MADFGTHGIKIDGNISVDVTKMMANKAKAVTGLTGGIEFLFKKYKVLTVAFYFRYDLSHENVFSFLIGGLCQGLGRVGRTELCQRHLERGWLTGNSGPQHHLGCRL